MYRTRKSIFKLLMDKRPLIIVKTNVKRIINQTCTVARALSTVQKFTNSLRMHPSQVPCTTTHHRHACVCCTSAMPVIHLVSASHKQQPAHPVPCTTTHHRHACECCTSTMPVIHLVSASHRGSKAYCPPSGTAEVPLQPNTERDIPCTPDVIPDIQAAYNIQQGTYHSTKVIQRLLRHP
jgi:hypothetical protein